MFKKSIFFNNKIKKYRKCPALLYTHLVLGGPAEPAEAPPELVGDADDDNVGGAEEGRDAGEGGGPGLQPPGQRLAASVLNQI